MSGAAIAGTEHTTLSGSVAVAARVSNVAIPVTIIAVGVGERELQRGDALLQSGSTGHHFEANLAYGFPGANDRLTLTPGLALALAPDSRT
ncbi:MAG: hypothetical protein OXF67_00415 [Cyanobacteria bacterium MAG CAR4_bin_6]|nr:hypothetical protein [Cyanobacteria bacterium MAG CAR4_bin_6]